MKHLPQHYEQVLLGKKNLDVISQTQKTGIDDPDVVGLCSRTAKRLGLVFHKCPCERLHGIDMRASKCWEGGRCRQSESVHWVPQDLIIGGREGELRNDVPL